MALAVTVRVTNEEEMHYKKCYFSQLHVDLWLYQPKNPKYLRNRKHSWSWELKRFIQQSFKLLKSSAALFKHCIKNPLTGVLNQFCNNLSLAITFAFFFYSRKITPKSRKFNLTLKITNKKTKKNYTTASNNCYFISLQSNFYFIAFSS